jgi:hypothetical protein
MTQVPINPPPWGPRRDPHFAATHTFEAYGFHTQVNAEQAALFSWYYRPEWYKRLVPDTRRCLHCGAIVFDPLPLTEAQEALLYTQQDKGMATGPIG